jgi:hypothetical protein
MQVEWEFWTNSNDECGVLCEKQRKFIKVCPIRPKPWRHRSKYTWQACHSMPYFVAFRQADGACNSTDYLAAAYTIVAGWFDQN